MIDQFDESVHGPSMWLTQEELSTKEEWKLSVQNN